MHHYVQVRRHGVRRRFGAVLLFVCSAALSGRPANTGYKISETDIQLLSDLEFRSFRYFWEQAGRTGIVRDRAFADGALTNAPNVHIGSAAATGFGLTAICIGADRNWISRQQAIDRVLTTLRFLSDHAPREHGWFYHWMDPDTGERVWNSEVSSIDSAILLAGVITAGQYFADEPEIVELSKSIYASVDFPWMLNGDPYLLCHGWTPEAGFLPYRWDRYSELMILYILAIGSPSHPIPPAAWYAWKRPQEEFEGIRFISGGPLFTHQYSHAWFDFRKLREKPPNPVDWFENSIAATRAQQRYCYKLAIQHPSYRSDMWGITASDSAMGYTIWGEPPKSAQIDGTLVPSAAGGSLMLAPVITIPVIRNFYEIYGTEVYRRYGFVDAFNPSAGWIGQDVVGIDVGIILLSAENLRTGFIWDQFMSSTPATLALQQIGVGDSAPERNDKKHKRKSLRRARQ